jgi:mRNA-degrading endonuclease RelE of RelBE toxin-antitoxin system
MKVLLHRSADKYLNRLQPADRDRFDAAFTDLEKEPLYTIEPATPEESRKAERRIREYHRDPSSFVPFKKRVTG